MAITGRSTKNKPSRAWQRMLSGRRLDLLDPSPMDIEINDIAHGLARVARWNGQTTGEHAFSVAQHSLLVEQIFSQSSASIKAQDKMIALLHDAPEYVIGDMISPFKAVMGGNYRQIEARLESAIHLRFSLPALLPRSLKTAIKKADAIAAYFEAIELAGFSEKEAADIFGRPKGYQRSQFDLRPLPTSVIQQQFIDRFSAIEAELELING